MRCKANRQLCLLFSANTYLVQYIFFGFSCPLFILRFTFSTFFSCIFPMEALPISSAGIFCGEFLSSPSYSLNKRTIPVSLSFCESSNSRSEIVRHSCRFSNSSFSRNAVFVKQEAKRVRIKDNFQLLVRSGAPTSDGVATADPPPPPSAPIKQVSDVRIVKISKGISAIRGRCNERLKFEVEYGLKQGTSENSYLITGPEGTALIDVPDQAFKEAFVDVLQKDVGVKNIKYLVIGHISPKRMESLQMLGMARGADAEPFKVFCSNPASKMIVASLSEDLLKKSFDINIVRQGDSLDLGGDRILEFILTPTPRWPDGMVTYDSSSLLLFSHKLFSAHISTDNDFDVGGWDVFGEHWRFFYDCMLAPVARQAEATLEKLPISCQFSQPSYSGKQGLEVVKADLGYIWKSLAKALNLNISQASFMRSTRADESLVVSAICPLHGPMVRYSLTELVREYKEWTAEKVKQAEEATIAVIFASAYGNTSAMAQAISRGILKAGVGCETVNCEQSSSADVAALVKRSCGFVVGSPTLGGHMPTPVQEALGVILQDPEARSKPCGVFGSFGWSGEAVDEMEQRLKDGGFKFAFSPIRCKFKPTESMIQTCEESGTDLAQNVKKTNKIKKKSKDGLQFTVASNMQQAVGRIVGALCVVSARSGDAESAMLASWVSQASFTPPGVTIAVAKERAVEGLLLPGSSFVLNVLGNDNAGRVSKQLLKAFKPGEPRFGDLEVKEAPCGAKILKDAISYLECFVESRMDAGDHWVLYGTVKNGELQDDKTVTAVHYRKTGERY